MTPETFIKKWTSSTLTERAAAQSHFNDLCELLGVEKPTDADPKGDWYCFERGAAKTAGGDGWADVWKRGHFGWEYKGKKKNLILAYAQLQQYAVALENPPLLIVSDMDRFVIHTNWTNTISETHTILLDDLLDHTKREMLRFAFTDPERLKPSKTTDALTEEVADKFAQLAISLGSRGHPPELVAHFLNRLIFCMFAEDIGLLPKQIFAEVIEAGFQNPGSSELLLSQLFSAMATGGFFGVTKIEWFNGGLFDDATALPLTRTDLELVGAAASRNWSDIDPSIFGTLFERGLDPKKRSQLGAHYTDAAKIMTLVTAVVIDPLLTEWENAKAIIAKKSASQKRKKGALDSFLERLRKYRVLDPACGSGNFLYVALLALKDLEHRVGLEAEALGLGRQFVLVGPEVVQGLEINSYAAELARVTVWIGEIQWMLKHGFSSGENPILKPLNNIRTCDALINSDGSPTDWPTTDAIIGNPPFLGSRKMGPELGVEYTSIVRRAYKDSVSEGADLVCYWFAKAWRALCDGRASRAGLIATNSISDGSSRRCLEPIADAQAIYGVWRNQRWVVDGADVDVHLICFAKNAVKDATIDGVPVSRIFADLHAPANADALDLTTAKRLEENSGISFQGVVPRANIQKKKAKELGLPPASFAVSGEDARNMLGLTGNPNGKPNSDVLVPYLIGQEIGKHSKDRFIVDFGTMSEKQASLYENPFAYILAVKAHRAAMTQPEALATWWQHWRTRQEMRTALKPLSRYIATSRVAKHRLFVWRTWPTLPDNAVVVFAKDDDTTFGVLHSSFHRAWSLRMGSSLQDRPRYTSTTTFETFPFPEGLTPNLPAQSYLADPRAQAIAEAAKVLNELRETWLHPASMATLVDAGIHGAPPRWLPVDAKAARELKKRTLVELYNAAPQWLLDAHKDLNVAVASAYGWAVDITEEASLQKLLSINRQRKESATLFSAENDEEEDEEEESE